MTDLRMDPPHSGGEREILSDFLDYHRATLEMKCAGLRPTNSVRAPCRRRVFRYLAFCAI